MSQEHASISGPKLWITVAAMLASLMAVLDISIVNVAINDIRASFGVQIDQIAWISTGYMMANVIVIPLTGWFQKRFGLRNYFIFSVLLFTIASLLCGLSWDLPSMTVFRILQGVGGGAIIPTASTILMSRYPKEQQGMAQAFVGLGAITGPLLGPTLGGYLIEYFSWHMIFLINIPFGILAIFLAIKCIQEPNFQPSFSPLSIKGVSLLVLGLGTLQYVLEEGNRHDWFNSALIVFFSIVSATCLITFCFQQLESEHPMVDLRIFTSRNYILCSIINFFLGVCLFSASFLFSLFCGTILNYSPLEIGLLFLKGCFIQVIMMPVVGIIVPKVDGRFLIMIGIICVAISIYLNASLTQLATNESLIFILFVRSLGLACVFIPLSVMAVNDVHPKELGNAVGLFNLTRELGGSIGLAIMSTNLMNHIIMYGKYLRNNLSSGNPDLHNQIQMMNHFFFGKVPNPSKASEIFIQSRLSGQASVLSFQMSFTALYMIFFASIFIVFFIKKLHRKKMPKGLDIMH